jgi:hypothetical protein
MGQLRGEPGEHGGGLPVCLQQILPEFYVISFKKAGMSPMTAVQA